MEGQTSKNWRSILVSILWTRLTLENWRAKLISLLLAITVWYLIKKNVEATPSRIWEPFSNARYGTALRARDGEWQIDKRPPAVVLPVTYSFLRNFLGAGFAPESRLTSCSVFRQTASMEAEIDCKLQSNSI